MDRAAPQTLARPAAPQVLVVGDDQLAAVLRQAGNGRAWTVERVDDDLMALGRLGQISPDVLVGQRRCLGEPRLAPLVQAFHQLSPRTRLLLLTAPGDGSAAEDQQAGFDLCLAEPVGVEDWRSVMAHALGPLAEPAAPHTPPVAEPSAATPVPPPAPNPPVPPAVAPAAEPVAAAAAPVLPPEPEADQVLGDVDLVDHLLHRGHHVGDLGARVVAQRSGLAGVGFARSRQQVPPGSVRVPVRGHKRALGHLYAAPPATAQELEPWAQWLAKWVLLQRRMDRLYHDAHTDPLTGVFCRRYFDRFLKHVLDRAAGQRFQVTVMLFDIDDFKIYNDRYGHAAGDEILIETAKLMQSVVRKHDVVARIGGDEFAVIFWDPEGPRRPNSQHPIDVQSAADRFQRAICEQRFPKLFDQARGTLTISGGLAGFPWDGRTPEELLNQADLMALRSKQQGKNAITFGPGAARSCRIARGEEPAGDHI